MRRTATIKLGSAFSIDILLHWSFFLLPLFVLWLSFAQGDTFSTAAIWMVFLLIILASVLVHELGHALAAKRLGIPIVDIMLTPICGLARLERAPDRPRDEVFVALSGPLANCVVAVLAAGLIWLNGKDFSYLPEQIRSSLLLTVFWANVSLFVLNLLPIFPMDGGRVLRAVLAGFFTGKRATLIAARIGQVASIGIVVFGLVQSIFPLVIIGVFLLLTAEQEIRSERRFRDQWNTPDRSS